MQQDPYRTPRAILGNDAGARPIRIHALAAGSVLVGASAYVANATLPGDMPIAAALGIVLGIAAAGGFVAARLGRPWHAAHAAIVGVVFGFCARALTEDPLPSVLSDAKGWVAMTAMFVAASLVGGWVARTLKLTRRRA